MDNEASEKHKVEEKFEAEHRAVEHEQAKIRAEIETEHKIEE